MKIGVLGGTFNPIHLGHIRLAQESKDKLRLDKVIFVPAYLPPHKLNKDIIPWKDRYNMVRLAIEGRADFEVSSIEMKLKGASYSVNTIKEFKKIYGESAQIFFIAGLDSIEELKDWKDIENLKRLCRFTIATRPGYSMASVPEDTTAIEVDTPDISSTQIRNRIKEKRPFKELVPEKVYDYIIKKRLYL